MSHHPVSAAPENAPSGSSDAAPPSLHIAFINPTLANEGARLVDAIGRPATIGGGCSGDAPSRVTGGCEW